MFTKSARAAKVELTLPNVLSLSRIPLAAALWAARKRPAVLAAIVGGAAITDLLDGWFARRHLPLSQRLGFKKGAGSQTAGAWLDPLCDKLFVTSLGGVLLAERRLSPAAVGLVSLRELLLLPLLGTYRFVPGLRQRLPLDWRASWFGKLTTAAQFLTLGAALLDSRWVRPLSRLTAAAGLVTVLDYARRAALTRPVG